MVKSEFAEPWDTTTNDSLDDVAAQPATPPPIKTKQASIPELREDVRGRIALLLIALLAVVILGAIALVFLRAFGCAITSGDIKDILTVVLPPVVALVGSATGFYFGGRND